MKRKNLRMSLVGGAVVLALAGAALGARHPTPEAPVAPSLEAPAKLAPFELAKLLSQAPPDAVVIRLDEADPQMLGSVPASAFGNDDEALLEAAPKARRIVLAGADAVRVDRLARRLLGSGRQVSVLEGGIDAWNQAMKQDPKEPEAGAPAEVWTMYKENVALRRYFGDDSVAPPPVVKAPAPVMAPPPPPKKREGC